MAFDNKITGMTAAAPLTLEQAEALALAMI